MAGAEHRYTLAGVNVHSPWPLPWPKDSGFADLSLRLLALRDVPGGPTGRVGLPADAAALPPAEIALDGQTVWVDDRENPDRLSAAVRRAVAYASWLQGATVLHAACVAAPEGALALLAGSGTGKSTLAAALAHRGLRHLADDLTPVRVRDRLPCVPTGPGARLEPLAALCFLERSQTASEPTWSPLPPKQALASLLHQGFGDLGVQELWQTQFLALGDLADSVPSWRLEIPDDLSLLAKTAEEIQTWFRRRLTARRPA